MAKSRKPQPKKVMPARSKHPAHSLDFGAVLTVEQIQKVEARQNEEFVIPRRILYSLLTLDRLSLKNKFSKLTKEGEEDCGATIDMLIGYLERLKIQVEFTEKCLARIYVAVKS